MVVICGEKVSLGGWQANSGNRSRNKDTPEGVTNETDTSPPWKTLVQAAVCMCSLDVELGDMTSNQYQDYLIFFSRL